MDHNEMRKIFNSRVKPEFRETHTPQCKKCFAFHPWGEDGMIIHHRKALIDGGTNDTDNLVVLCPECHKEWHEHIEETGASFDEWLQKPPLRFYSALAMVQDEIERNTYLANLEKEWVFIADKRMINQPFKDDKCRQYVKQYSSQWIDW